jgi:hypothetical protein
MGKKCIICGNDARFQIKDTSDYYCDECAEEQFDDLSLLVKVDDEAKRLKKIIDKEDSEDIDASGPEDSASDQEDIESAEDES